MCIRDRGLHLGIGLALSFSYILFQTIASTFAVNGNMPPVIAVWIPNIICLLYTSGFEPTTPCSQSRCANRTALHPEYFTSEKRVQR